MVPLSVLGKLRHAMVDQLAESNALRPAGIVNPAEVGAAILMRLIWQHWRRRGCEFLLGRWISCARLLIWCAESCAEFQDIREYRAAVEIATGQGATAYLATPRIQKSGEAGIVRAMAKHGTQGFLVRNLAIAFCAEQGIPFVADFSLNAANQWTVDYLRSCGSERVTVSYDLNRDQLLELVDAVPAGWLEVVIHQHMPMFHMEHCVFCRGAFAGDE